MKVFAYAALIALVLPLAGEAKEWNIDTGHSTVSFEVLHLGVAKSTGRFNEFEGVLHFDPAMPEAASVEVTIQTGSVDTGDEKRDGHLMSPDFFNVEENPVITFKSTSVAKTDDGMVAKGMLQFNGVEKEVSFPFVLVGTGQDPWGGTRAGFSAETTLSRKEFNEFGAKYPEPALGDDVTVAMNLEVILAEKAEAEAVTE